MQPQYPQQTTGQTRWSQTSRKNPIPQGNEEPAPTAIVEEASDIASAFEEAGPVDNIEVEEMAQSECNVGDQEQGIRNAEGHILLGMPPYTPPGTQRDEVRAPAEARVDAAASLIEQEGSELHHVSTSSIVSSLHVSNCVLGQNEHVDKDATTVSGMERNENTQEDDGDYDFISSFA